MTKLRFRQVHLDFHTSEKIAGIGSQFDPEEFAATLQAAHVDSITCFARCHHGMLYYDTQKFPERRHPHLTRNLLAEQIEACHARNIRVPLYITVRWDYYTSTRHPEWVVVDEKGCLVGTPPFEPGFYRNLCLNTGYVDFLAEQTAEVCELLPTDGVFFDIVFPVPCACHACLEGMLAQGLDPSRAEDRWSYARDVCRRFQERMTGLVQSYHPEATIFYNAGHVGPSLRHRLNTFTHLELESLPSGGWGYLHFPVTSRFARTLGLDLLGMTGKFHTSWGDFSSLKNPAALEFECLAMLAAGAKCSVGDQLHPTGRIDPATYDLIGGVYAQVEAAEPWCADAEPQVEVGVLTPEEFVTGSAGFTLPGAALGATRMLQELHQQFDLVDSETDFARYRVLILPDEIPVGEALAAKLRAFLAGGGKLLASAKSGLTPEGDRFALAEMGLEYVGPAPYSPDFLVPGKLGEGLADTGYVMYLPGVEVRPQAGAEVLSPVLKPYFNRTWEHFCSHYHTPAEGPADYPGVVQNGGCLYFMHPVFTQYHQNAPLWCKRLVGNALARLLPEPLVKTTAPSAAVVTLNAQPAQNRLVVHLLHYVPERRGQAFDTIEEVLPITGVCLSVRVDQPVSEVRLVPQEQGLEFRQEGGRVEFLVPEVRGTQMVEIRVG